MSKALSPVSESTSGINAERVSATVEPRSIILDIEERALLDETLDWAVTQLTAEATSLNHGILVTRSSPSRFTVSVSPDVPHGMTREQLNWP